MFDSSTSGFNLVLVKTSDPFKRCYLYIYIYIYLCIYIKREKIKHFLTNLFTLSHFMQFSFATF